MATRGSCRPSAPTTKPVTPLSASSRLALREGTNRKRGIMNAPAITNSPIVAAYCARTQRSAAAYETARRLMPGGVTHDVRFMRPHPIYVEHAAGARKRDLDGNEYVDFQ